MRTALTLGYPVNPQLPLPDKISSMRSAGEVVGRIFAMFCTAAAAYGFERSKSAAWLNEESSNQYLTPREAEFLRSGAGDRQSFADQVEGIFALTWAVSITKQLDFASPCPNDFISIMPNLKSFENGQAFRRKSRLRPEAEIELAVDLAFCLHWAIRDSQLRSENIPGRVEEYVVIERRRALEWLISDAPWDEIELNT